MNHNNGRQFSTKDRDNDDWSTSGHCAESRRSGWWHESCTRANLNAQYYSSKQDNIKAIYWYDWRNYDSLKRVEMKIKPN